MNHALVDQLEGIKSEVLNKQSLITSSINTYKERLEMLNKLDDMADSVVTSIDTVISEIETFNEEYEDAESEDVIIE